MTPTGAVITAMDVRDVRFPTSEQLDGSDAMTPDPDYSAAYVMLWTSDRPGRQWRLAAVDHLHGHFVDPVRMRKGHYRAPPAPGLSAEMHPESLESYAYPSGPVWAARGA